MTNHAHVTIYTDGGSLPNPGPGGWAALLIADSGHIKELSGSDPDTTNNRMELTAAIEALRALNRPCEVTLFTDSEYLRNGITGWLHAWIANDWQTSQDEPVKNRDLWQALHAETQRHHITWQWVKGHAGDEHNERVDHLATAARERLTAPAPDIPASPPADFTPDYEAALRVSVPTSGGPGGWAIRTAHVHSGGTGDTQAGQEASTTSSRLELVAALAALRATPPGAAVRVYCPGEYVYKGMTEWVAGWQRRGWKTASKKPVQHQDLWRALVDEAARRTVAWTLEGDPRPAVARGLGKLAADAVGSPPV